MSREDYEQSEQSFLDEEFSRGPGDPDYADPPYTLIDEEPTDNGV